MVDIFPNEIIRTFLEHFSPQQRIGVSRVSKMWRYLVASFQIVRSYSMIRTFGYRECGWNQSDRICGIDVDTKGHIVVAIEQRIKIFDENDELLFEFGSKGTEDGQFNYIGSIAIDQSNGNIAVTDRYADRVQVFDQDGKFMFKFGSRGKDDGHFIQPRGIAFDNSNLFVVDQDNSRVQVFDQHGKFMFKFGSCGHGETEFWYPEDIAINPKTHRIIITDTYNHRVQIYDQQGKFISSCSGCSFNYPSGTAITPQGLIVVTECYHTWIFDERGQFMFELERNEEDKFSETQGVTTDRQGRIIIISRYHSKVQIFKPIF